VKGSKSFGGMIALEDGGTEACILHILHNHDFLHEYTLRVLFFYLLFMGGVCLGSNLTLVNTSLRVAMQGGVESDTCTVPPPSDGVMVSKNKSVPTDSAQVP